MKTLRKGSKGGDVIKLQKALSSATNYFDGAWDGEFGKVTEATVKTFQKYSGLVVDGVVGAKTWAALGSHVPSDTDNASGDNAEGEPGTEHFKMSEFACHNGTSVPKQYWGNLQALMNWLEKIRSACGNRRVSITSGYRPPDYNKSVGGAKNSQHLYAAAADITVEGMSPSEVYEVADKVMGSIGGVGKYKDFTHVDCRNYRARWNG